MKKKSKEDFRNEVSLKYGFSTYEEARLNNNGSERLFNIFSEAETLYKKYKENKK